VANGKNSVSSEQVREELSKLLVYSYGRNTKFVKVAGGNIEDNRTMYSNKYTKDDRKRKSNQSKIKEIFEEVRK
jgi:hypothetical protein